MRRTVLIHLWAMALIAYIQRTALSVPLEEIGRDVGASTAGFDGATRALGFLQSAWYFGYAVCQLPGGSLADRCGGRRALVLLAVLWSLATAAAACVRSYWALVTAWTLMGCLQAGAFPCAVRSIGQLFGDRERARASSWLVAGMLTGGAVAPLLTAALIDGVAAAAWADGMSPWRLCLAVYAAPGILWAAAYWFMTRSAGLDAGPAAVSAAPAGAPACEPVWRRLTTDPSIWLLCGQQFLRAAAMLFFVTWFPTFLRETRGVSLMQSGLLTTYAGAAALLGVLAGGYASDWLLARTGNKRLARQGLAVLGMGSCSVLMLLSSFVTDVNAAIVLISLGAFIAMFGGVAGYTVAIDYGGDRVGTVFGAMNTAGGFGAMLFPVTIGWLVSATGTWNAALMAFVALMAVDAVLWAVLNPRGTFMRAVPAAVAVVVCQVVLGGPPAAAASPEYDAARPAAGPMTDADRQAVRERVAGLEGRLAAIETARRIASDRVADARLHLEAVQRVLDYEPAIDDAGRGQIEATLKAGAGRIADLEAGKHPWTAAAGRSLRGFRSAVDGSTQPFFVIVPQGHDPAAPIRLDVNLHGSMPRRTAIGVLDFLLNGVGGGGGPDFIELQPLGRLGENAYRFEGETDVFEAIEAVCRQFHVDRRRIVLRGSSLGGVAAWQIGLKRPDRFVAVGPAAGPVDTLLFAAAPWPHFIKLAPLAAWQQKMLHMVDAIDYAANAGMVPVVAAMGDEDPYFPSHVQIKKAFAAEGIPFTGLTAAGVGHALDGKTRAEQMRLLAERAAAGVPVRPPHVRFVTWTLAFSRCHWIELLGLDAHYDRAEIEASLAADGSVAVTKLANIARFAIASPALDPPADGGPEPAVTINGRPVPLPPRTAAGPRTLVFARAGDGWKCLGDRGGVQLSGKRPGLQGPIDDAFRTPFLCVRGTGKPTHEAVGRWADATLRRFHWEWGRHYRGTLPVKDDTAVTPEDIRDRNLVLFGDPGSNRLIREVLPKLATGSGVQWSADTVRVGAAAFPAADHGLALIAPNPLPGAADRYVVLNSGHTYHDPELRLSYMVFPRLGDWGMFRVGDGPQPPAASPAPGGPVPMPTVAETLQASGFFDERWLVP